MSAEALAEELDTDENIDEGDEYLTFHLADEEYGVDILRVREIRGWETVTPIPNSPEFVKGVLNLRGSIVPVIDLRVRFNLPATEYTHTTVVVVLSVISEDGERERIMGVVVDAISDVVNANLNEIQATPDFDSSIEIQYIQGLATAGDNMIMLVDVDKLLDIQEISGDTDQSAD